MTNKFCVSPTVDIFYAAELYDNAVWLGWGFGLVLAAAASHLAGRNIDFYKCWPYAKLAVC